MDPFTAATLFASIHGTRLVIDHAPAHSPENQTQCYRCRHRRPTYFNTHSACASPPATLKVDAHGVRNGWVLFPVNFDPVWLADRCSRFTPTAQEG